MGSSSYSDTVETSLAADIALRLAKTRRNARRNYFIAYGCGGAAIVGSFAATLCVAFGDLPKPVIAGLTALPGTALLLNNVLALEKKAQWSWKKVRKYDSMLMCLRHEARDVSAAAKELREFEEKMEEEYPRFGMLPADPKKMSS